MFVNKNSMSSKLKKDLNKSAGYREKEIMQKADYVTISENGRNLKFTMKNPNYGKDRYETTKSVSATFDLEKRTWIN